MTPRYRILATFPGQPERQYGTAETLHGALNGILDLLRRGATHACQHDTRPDEPPPVTDAERAAMAEMSKHVTRNFG